MRLRATLHLQTPQKRTSMKWAEIGELDHSSEFHKVEIFKYFETDYNSHTYENWAQECRIDDNGRTIEEKTRSRWC